MKILYQGNEGAYSQLAAVEIFPQANLISCKTFEDCFQKCTNDETLRAIIPIENSRVGTIIEVIDYLIKSKNLFLFLQYQLSSIVLLSSQFFSLKSSLFKYKISYNFTKAGKSSICFRLTFFLFNLC